ncbi:Aste57867_266 [Aphanomyces stellatus]|uniref:Aste57867_266 protein n=1 Tax=Aphanomyces stellatus TaxID=120398 RepID=A0A485K3C5_9STRA|nr:hypothetical protein As57867_000266 [Aphanomyces stellatus]VFT77492.1 Aste57867_266 [Aphanomyces stellatus]
MSTTCFFNDCTQVVVPGSWKCDFHRNRNRCLVTLCQNQVYARHLCVRHGGKRRCDIPDCDRNVRIGSFCILHGTSPVKKKCTEDGCTSVAHKRQKCVRHGGGRQCHIDGCKTHARSGGYCFHHARRTAYCPPTRERHPSSVNASSALKSIEEQFVLDWTTMVMLLKMEPHVEGENGMYVECDAGMDDHIALLATTETLDVDSIALERVLADFACGPSKALVFPEGECMTSSCQNVVAMYM